MPQLFERVAIAGVGLIGGSLALAARRAGAVGEVVGYGRSAGNLETAKQRGIIDRYTHDPQEAVRGCDLVVLAVPVSSLAQVAAACAPGLRADAVVSDVGSVKQAVVQAVEPCLPAGVSFVGAHPIAGTEDSGAAAADAKLFLNRRCVLTPSSRSTPAAVAKVRALWQAAGMEVCEMDAARHDEILAWVSHLPHAIAFSMVDALAAADADAAAFAGPSFESLTRVAASSASTWSDILLSNSPAIAAAQQRFVQSLARLFEILGSGDAEQVTRWLDATRATHLAWRSEAAKRSSPA